MAWLTCVEERHQQEQGDHNVEGEAAGHLNVGPAEPLFILRDCLDLCILIPLLVWRSQAQVLDNMDELSKQVLSCSEFPGGGNLDNEHEQSVGRHDDEEHLERLLQGEEGVEGVGGRGSNISVAPPVKLTPAHALVQSPQLNCVIGILVSLKGPEYFLKY